VHRGFGVKFVMLIAHVFESRVRAVVCFGTAFGRTWVRFVSGSVVPSLNVTPQIATPINPFESFVALTTADGVVIDIDRGS